MWQIQSHGLFGGKNCSQFVKSAQNNKHDLHFGGCPGVPVHGGIPIVFISIHGVLMQFVNVSFLCVPVQEDTTHFFIDNYRYNCSLLTPVYFLTKISQQTVLDEHFKLWLGCKFRTWFVSVSSFVDSFTWRDSMNLKRKCYQSKLFNSFKLWQCQLLLPHYQCISETSFLLFTFSLEKATSSSSKLRD